MRLTSVFTNKPSSPSLHPRSSLKSRRILQAEVATQDSHVVLLQYSIRLADVHHQSSIQHNMQQKSRMFSERYTVLQFSLFDNFFFFFFWFIYLFTYLSIYLFIYLYLFMYLFIKLFGHVVVRVMYDF